MKIGVIGSTGMAGHLISQYLQDCGHQVITLGRKKHPYVQTEIIEVYDIEKVKKTLENYKFDVIINCLGLLNDNASNNRADAIFINSYYPNMLTENFKNSSTKIIHLSTDCVFSGEDGPYTEKSVPNGRSFYDVTKIIGEFDSNKDLILRNSIIGPELKENGIGLFNWFMNQSETIKGFTNVMWNGVTTLFLAKQIHNIITKFNTLSGIYHLVGTPISKHDLLYIFKDAFNKNVIIESWDKPVSCKVLINTRKDFQYISESYIQMIHEMKLWITRHKYMYHYVY